MTNTEQVVLYHGSNLEIRKPLLSKSTAVHPGGTGFFAVTRRAIASKFCLETMRKSGGHAVVSAYAYNKDNGCLRILELTGDTTEKLRSIDLCTHSAAPSAADEGAFAVGYDLIVVDNIRPGSRTYIFKTEEALRHLSFLGSRRLFFDGFFHRIFWAIANPLNDNQTIRKLRRAVSARKRVPKTAFRRLKARAADILQPNMKS